MGIFWYSSRPLEAVHEARLSLTGLGQVMVYQGEDASKGLLWLFSDRDGWNTAMVEQARRLTDLAYGVVGVDVTNLHEMPSMPGCLAVDEWLKAASPGLIRRFSSEASTQPILMGEGVGGAWVHDLLVNSSTLGVHAGLSLDFCPDVAVQPPLCGSETKPSKAVSNWYVFQAQPACDQAASIHAIQHEGGGHLVDSTYKATPTERRDDQQTQVLALLQWLDPRLSDQVLARQTDSGLPVITVDAASGTDSVYAAILLTGDGGWAELDKSIAAGLAGHGIPTLALDSLSYFWTPRTPESAGPDFEALVRIALSRWQGRKIFLVGYSFGADALPFLVNRLPAELRDHLAMMALLGLGTQASFEFHLTDWLSAELPNTHYPVVPELARLQKLPVYCVMGTEEENSACPQLEGLGAGVLRIPGDHHFNGDYEGVVKGILGALDRTSHHSDSTLPLGEGP